MATWSHIRTLTGLAPVWICSDGTTIYFVSNHATGNDVYSWVASSDTLTKIMDNAVITDWHRCRSLTYFNGNLYALVDRAGGTSSLDVLRYDGTPNSVTVVKSLTRTNASYCGLLSNSAEMVVFGVRFSIDNQETHYTANGTSWTAGSWATDPHCSTSFTNYAWSFATEWPLGFFIETCRGSGSSCTSIDIEQWNTSAKQWQVEKASYNYDFKFTSPNGNIHWTDTEGDYTADFTTIFSTEFIAQQYQTNMPYTLGVNDADGDIYFWNISGAWNLLDTTSFTLAAVEKGGVVRLTNNIPYLFTTSGTHGNEYVIFGRSEAIISAANAVFYQGAGTLVEKFTLPFAGVNPEAMTLDASLGTIVIGSDEAAVEPVVFSTNPYVTGTLSATNFPLTVGITGLDWI